MATNGTLFKRSPVNVVASDPKREGYGNSIRVRTSSPESPLQVTRKEKGMATDNRASMRTLMSVASDPKKEGYGNSSKNHSSASYNVASDPKGERYYLIYKL